MSTTIKEAYLKITIDNALALRQLVSKGKNSDKLEFLCPNCNEPVQPHSPSKQGAKKNTPAHFEHKKGKTDCKLTHKPKSKK